MKRKVPVEDERPSTSGRVYNAIVENQGICYSKIMQLAKIGNGTLSHHLHRLEKKGMIVSRSCGRYRRFWTSDYWGLKNYKVLSMVCQEIMNCLDANDHKITVGEISSNLGISHQRVCYNLRKLEMEGMVSRKRQGRKTYCALNDTFSGTKTHTQRTALMHNIEHVENLEMKRAICKKATWRK